MEGESRAVLGSRDVLICLGGDSCCSTSGDSKDSSRRGKAMSTGV